MKLRNLFVVLIILGITLFGFTGCGSDDPAPAPAAELKLSSTALNISVSTDTSVTITSGNGGYVLQSSDTKIATAALSDNKDVLKSVEIIIKGVAAGTATITIKDSANKEAKIIVTVTQPASVNLQGTWFISSISSDVTTSNATLTKAIKNGIDNFQYLEMIKSIASITFSDAQNMVVTVNDGQGTPAVINGTYKFVDNVLTAQKLNSVTLNSWEEKIKQIIKQSNPSMTDADISTIILLIKNGPALANSSSYLPYSMQILNLIQGKSFIGAADVAKFYDKSKLEEVVKEAVAASNTLFTTAEKEELTKLDLTKVTIQKIVVNTSCTTEIPKVINS